jgi:hypothetical protein
MKSKKNQTNGSNEMVDQIAAALLGGLGAAVSEVASEAVKDAYAALKELLRRKLGEKSEVADAITKLELKPESEGRQATVVEELAAAKSTNDAELVQAAERLQAALHQLPAEAKTQIQRAVGKYIAQATGGSTATVSVVRESRAPKP